MIPIYFNGVGDNPVQLAEQNIEFYRQFLEEWRGYGELWPSETYREFIKRFVKFGEETKDEHLKKKAKELEDIYRALPGRPLINQTTLKLTATDQLGKNLNPKPAASGQYILSAGILSPFKTHV